MKNDYKKVEPTTSRKQRFMNKVFVSNGMKKLAILLTLAFAVTFAGVAFAGNSPKPPGPTTVNITLINPLAGHTTSVGGVINNIMQWLITAGSPIAALMVIIGGIQILVSGGEPAKFEKGKKTILYTAVGYGIILVGSGIISIVQKILTG